MAHKKAKEMRIETSVLLRFLNKIECIVSFVKNHDFIPLLFRILLTKKTFSYSYSSWQLYPKKMKYRKKTNESLIIVKHES